MTENQIRATSDDTDVRVRPATPADRPAVERLWLMFRHDLSEFQGDLPAADGTFRSERVDAAFSAPGWAPYLLTRGDRAAGLAFVRGLDGPVRVLNSFFVARGARRAGVGLRAAREVLRRHPGRWEIAFQENNPGAVAFWHRLAEDLAPGAWSREARPVPGRPELPPDLWISLTVRP
ncbi:GNAT family N-acetyltransferase [Streptomyces sp. NEAU-sy36]|uniref:GNAT family N-acetyltransferase n=1 Tax=unclassified Streptomyces TaxID=2593676 RepID=UPI0015D5F34B|nr:MULTISPECIES: GNAT family N-acetyltransferase [unclassified Streptomyces]QLJ02022.1 GNAT family N-acetyltransferase [Streptomyces sp. NEAU-sy36]